MKGIALSEVVRIADQLFPFSQAEPWDNCGIQIGDPSDHVEAIAFSLDAIPETVAFAADNSCGLLVSHHPVIFEPIRSITPDSLVGRTLLHAARRGVGILSLHTNLDSARGGLNDHLAEIIGLEDIVTPTPALCARFGRLPTGTRISRVAEKLSTALNISGIRVIAREDLPVKKVFCVTGSGMGYLKEALAYNADLMVTGDVRYHDAREALEMGIPVIDAGHYGLEKIAVKLLSSAFLEQFTKLGIHVTCVPCRLEKDPFQIYIPSGGS
ncbi:MAG: Nif3-like dinuclear metal center hexameric protein [Desulfomonile tiedjei]|uniref:GTP cyclohydrolase 1 type 2 homolog n=1 Tax=Desulfomonile tiedjei TaxID=2358 RepID=A0A9D6Z595_9BACT|nr:Nif3-like dinuclear metal center hexameric protein [Desulfomonile tiedjei]